MAWIVSDSEGERREKGEENEDGLAVFDLAVGDNEKVIVMVNLGWCNACLHPLN